MMQRFARLLTLARVVALAVLCLMGTQLPSQAVIVLGGSTGSSGTGGFVLTNGNPIVDVFHPAYDNRSTGPVLPESNWVWDTISGTINNPITFEFGFDLTGFDASTATLEGLWGADNTAFGFLNGNPFASLPDPTIANFNPMLSLGVSPGSGFFNAGLNLLAFTVEDFGPPGAFRTAFLIQADAVSPVPLPGAASLFLLGLAGLGWIGWRRKTV